MAPKGLYSVQKSRSFGGVHKYAESASANEQPGGQKTPNFESLRKKFSKKKTTSFDDDDGDYVDGTGSTLKKKNKGVSAVGNILKWFRKDNGNNSREQQALFEQESLTPKIRRLAQKKSDGSKIIPFRSSSYDSICSVASAASSFAFVPVDAYKIGRYVECKKKIAIGINCGQDTYRRRLEQRENGLETDKDLTLKTKYNLLSSDSPPKNKARLPAGPLLALSELHRNDDTNSSSSECEGSSEGTIELESISQRGSQSPTGSVSPQRRQWSSVDQQRANKNTADQSCSPGSGQSIKQRELRGQLLHPTTIKVTEEQRRPRADSDGGTLKQTRQAVKVGSTAQPANNLLRDSEILPKKSAESQKCSVFHYPGQSNPFGDSVSLAPTLPLSCPPEPSGDSRPHTSHIPGKRRAPEPPSPPSRSLSPGESPGERNNNNNPFLRRKGPAPQPPPDQLLCPAACPALPVLAPGQHKDAAAADPGEDNSLAGRQRLQAGRMTGSAPSSPSSPTAGKKSVTNGGAERDCQDWVIQNGILKSLKESKTDLPVLLEQEKEMKEAKEVKAPLSPKPWYKRNLIKDNSDKRNKNKKAKTPENLPEIHTSREVIKVKETVDDKYSPIMLRMSKENLSEAPKSPQMFLRTKMMSGAGAGAGPGSPKTDRPNSRPISGLTGISELDNQAKEIIRRKNEDEAARRKANDEKFYTDVVEMEGANARRAIEAIMDNVSKKMTKLEGISKNNQDWDEILERDSPSQHKLESSEPCINTNRTGDKKIDPNSCDNKNVSNDIEQDFQCMGSVISDLNSFLASTRKALSSPITQKRNNIQPQPAVQVNEATVRRLTETETDNCGEKRNSSTGPTQLSDTDQKLNYFPPSKLSAVEYKSNLPPPPSPPSLPPLGIERVDGWSCGRCTLINFSATLWCEACGAQRENSQPQHTLEEANPDPDLDQDSAEKAPRVGNVLDKLVLFSSIDAKARETPSLQRKKSEASKLLRTYSSAMLPIDENPLQKTLERITVQQAELAKTKDCFNNNFLISKDANISVGKVGAETPEKKPTNQAEILVQQSRLFEEANSNLMKQKQQEENISFNERTSSLPSSERKSGGKIEIEEKMQEERKKLELPPPTPPSPLTEESIGSSARPRTESLTGCSVFDFTKTPRSFISQPTPKPWSKFGHEERKVSQVAAPRLEFLGSEVTRKISAPADNEKLRQARLQFFTGQSDQEKPREVS